MARPLRILHIIGNLERGGAQAMLLEIMRRLSPERFAQILVHFKNPNDFKGEVRERGWDCRKVRVTRAYRLGELLGLAREIRSIAPDIVHTHADFANFAGRAAAIHAGVPHVVVHYQNTYEHRYNIVFRRLEEELAGRTDAYIACSRGVNDFLAANFDLRGRPVALMPNAIDTGPMRLATQDREGARRLLGVPPHVFHILHTARLEPHKEPGRLIAALRLPESSALGDWRLTFVGGGSLREELERRLHSEDDVAAGRGEPRILPRVHFAGWSGQVPQWLATADVFCLVSRNEGLPLALVEAMAAGVPTVASDIVGPHEVLDESRFGQLVDAGDPAQLLAAITRCKVDGNYRAEIVDRGRQRAMEYSVEQYIPRLESFYEGLAAGTSLARQNRPGIFSRLLLLNSLRRAALSQRAIGPSGGKK